MADDAQELKIHIVSDADNSGFKSAAGASSDLGAANSKTKDATDDLSKAQEHGAEHANILHKNHRALHQILHLIGKEAGPEAALALAAIGAASGGGIMIGIMALKEMLEVIKQIHEASEKLEEQSRETATTIIESNHKAAEAIRELGEKNENFWKSIAEHAGANDSKSAFDSLIEKIRDTTAETTALVASMEKAGLITATDAVSKKSQAKQQGEEQESAARQQRMDLLAENVAALVPQLERLNDQRTSGPAAHDDAELLRAKEDLQKAAAAFKEGKEFKPTSSLIPYGFESRDGQVRNKGGDAEAGGGLYQSQYKDWENTFSNVILEKDQNKKAQAERTELLQKTIAKMNEEWQNLSTQNEKAAGKIEHEKKMVAIEEVGTLGKPDEKSKKFRESLTHQHFSLKSTVDEGHAALLEAQAHTRALTAAVIAAGQTHSVAYAALLTELKNQRAETLRLAAQVAALSQPR